MACVLFTMLAVPAQGLDFSSDRVVYEESFNGEVSFPITPEVDDINGGGLIGFSSSPNGFGPPPALTGTAAAESVSASGTYVEGVVFFSNSIGTDSFNLRGEFTGLSASSDAQAFVQVAANIDSGEFDVGSAQTILTIDTDTMGSPALSIAVVESDGSLPSGFNNFQEVLLPAPEAAALSGGAPFVIDCQVDRVAHSVTGSIDIVGFPSLMVGPMPFLFLSSTDPVVAAGQQLTVNLPASFVGTLVEVEIDNFRISRKRTPAVPALSPLGMTLLAGLLLGTAWSQRVRRTSHVLARGPAGGVMSNPYGFSRRAVRSRARAGSSKRTTAPPDRALLR